MTNRETWRQLLQTRVAEHQIETILARSTGTLRPKVTAGLVIAWVLSVLILMTPLLVAGIGIWITVFTGFSIIGLVLGFVFLVLAWFLLPSLTRIDGDLYGRDDLPATFDLIDRIGAQMGARKIDRISITPNFNAWIVLVGFRRQRVIGIGLAMWQVLNHQERIALLSHEMAHLINSDPARSGLIWNAEHALMRWIDVLTPDRHHDDADHIEPGFIVIIAEMLMRMAGYLVSLLLRALVLLRLQVSQQAEYYADLIAAVNAGAEATESLLHKTILQPIIRSLVVRGWSTSNGSGQDLMKSLNDRIEASYGDEIERLTQRMSEEKSSVDRSHPPTIYRLRFLSAHHDLEGEFDGSGIDWAEIEREIEPFLEPVGKFLMDYPDTL